jgi:hypothetical protein
MQAGAAGEAEPEYVIPHWITLKYFDYQASRCRWAASSMLTRSRRVC